MIENIVIQFLLASLLATLAFPAKSAHPPRLGKIQATGLNPEQARQLLIFTLKREGYNVSKRGIFFDGPLTNADGTSPHPGYADFGLGFANRKAGAIETVGLFSISISSGDIWETNTCENFSFPALRHIQQEIRSTTKISAADESALRRGLGCTD